MIILEQKVIPATDVETFEEEGYTVIKKNGKYYAYPKGYVDKKSDEIQIEPDEVESYEEQKYTVRKSPIDGKYYAKKKTVVATPTPDDGKDNKKPAYDGVKLPFTKSAESDAFRAWLLSKFPSYGEESKMSKSLTVAKPPSDYKTSEALKNAYFQKGEMYEKWVAGGGKVDPKTFEVNDGTYVPPSTQSGGGAPGSSGTSGTGGSSSSGQNTNMKGCKGWLSSDNPFEDLSDNDSVRNQLVSNFIKFYQEQTADIMLGIPSGKCGVEPKRPSKWIQEVFYDEDGQPMYAWQNPVIKNIAEKQTSWTSTSTGGEINTATWFEKWNIDREKKKQVDRFNTVQNSNATSTNSSSSTNNGSVVQDLKQLKIASDYVTNIKLNRQSCRKLAELSKGYNNNNNDISAAIEACRGKFENMAFGESLENKITGKLKLMKENKSLSESITNKIKSKKYEKTLGGLSEQFDKQNYRKFFDTLTKFRNNNINEATNTEFEKSFDVIFQGKETEFKNRAIEYILGKLEVSPSSELGKSIKSELDRVPAKDMFRNEYDVPEAISKAIETSSQSNNGKQTGLKGIVSQSIKFDDKQIKQGVRQHLHNYIEGVKDDIKSLEQKLKSSIVQGL
jgi:hypothetical protein